MKKNKSNGVKNKKIIIGLAGEFASGKGVVADYLVKKHRADSVRYSSILRDLLGRLYLPVSRENIQKVSAAIRQTFGEDIIAKVIAEDVKKIKKNIIVVDGVRRLADIKYLRELNGFKLINVVADLKTRYARLVARKENPGDENKTYKQFLRDHENISDKDVPEVMAQADEEIHNDGNLADLHKQIDKIFVL